VDRGTDSKGVIEQLLNLQSDFAHFLRGNPIRRYWTFSPIPARSRYGRTTAPRNLGELRRSLARSDDEAALRQTRDRLREALPASHLKFFETLKLSETIGDYFLHMPVCVPARRSISRRSET
jgi:hypothetical protein